MDQNWNFIVLKTRKSSNIRKMHFIINILLSIFHSVKSYNGAILGRLLLVSRMYNIRPSELRPFYPITSKSFLRRIFVGVRNIFTQTIHNDVHYRLRIESFLITRKKNGKLLTESCIHSFDVYNRYQGLMKVHFKCKKIFAVREFIFKDLFFYISLNLQFSTKYFTL